MRQVALRFRLTPEHVDVDGDGLPQTRRARVGAGVGGPRVLHHQEGGGHLALLGDDAHAAAGGVVGNDLEKKRSKNICEKKGNDLF